MRFRLLTQTVRHSTSMSHAIAYLIALHDQPAVALNLIYALYTPSDTFFIHVDAKASSGVYQKIQQHFGRFSNVVLSRNFVVNWGGWSQVELELFAIRHMLSISSTWEHLVNLSGHDIVVRPREALRAELSGLKGQTLLASRRPFLAWSTEEDLEEALLWFSRYSQFFVERDGQTREESAKPVDGIAHEFPAGVEWHHGSQWKVLSRSACTFLISNEHPLESLSEHFRYTHCPDESFIHTALMNSHLRHTILTRGLSYLIWPGPKVLVETDLEDILNSRCFFARKVILPESQTLISEISHRLGIKDFSGEHGHV